MPIDTESLEKIENVEKHGGLDLARIAKNQHIIEAEITRWRAIQELTEQPGWDEVRGMYIHVRDTLVSDLSDVKPMPDARLREARGELKTLNDIINLDEQAAIAIKSRQEQLQALSQELEAGAKAEATMRSSTWMPDPLRWAVEKAKAAWEN